MSAETQLAIMDAVPSVVATKEASANLAQIATIAAQAPSHVRVLAGDDDHALATIAVGGSGVIAVISNYAPVTFGELIRAALAGNHARAREIHAQLLPWYRANFLESNPIPVKYIMHKRHGIGLTYRLPMVPPVEATRSAIDAMLSSAPL
jgi:4-hydroxy-tetrahydrodipicolinate synthase